MLSPRFVGLSVSRINGKINAIFMKFVKRKKETSVTRKPLLKAAPIT